QLGSNDPDDMSHQIWQRKLRVFRRLEPRRLHVVVLNQAMVDMVRASPLLGKFSVSVIPNGLDTEEFAPRAKGAAREILGVPPNGRVVLFGADIMGVRRKGLRLLEEALNELEGMRDLFLLSMGPGDPDIRARIPHRHLGRVRDDRMLSIVYS